MDRVRKLKTVLWTLAGLALAVGATRFLAGLGATTNLSDTYPWGFWIGFDVMGGVALAAGGFVVTAIVYVFRREQFHPIVKPAVLTAFLGYIAVILGLLFDLGLPWNIWHMMVFWNPHSPLFEVGWCVMLYTTVLLLEFSPVPLAPFSAWGRVRAFLIKFRMVFVILGIGLSTLHQSSLGSLFLIMPYKVHALWYSPILPVLFFLSAVMLGLYMVSWESKFTAWAYRRAEERKLVAALLGGARWVAVVYLAVRFGDLAVRGQLGAAFVPGWYSGLFWTEILIMAGLPIVLSLLPRVLLSSAGQWSIASLGVFGVVLNRVDVGGLAHLVQDGQRYVPQWTEFVISAGVVSVAALVFLFMVERFKVWEQRPADPAAAPDALPEFEPVSHVSLGDPAHAAWVRQSMAFIVAVAVGFALMPFDRVLSAGHEADTVQAALGGDTLFVDGNRDDYGVFFPHEMHVAKNGGETSCARCHHMNLPGDRNSECASCHQRMYVTADAFRHDWHASPDGGNVSCARCHAIDQPKTAASLRDGISDCSGCHPPMVVEHAYITVDDYTAPSYLDAMHGLCVSCHKREMANQAQAVAHTDLPRTSVRGHESAAGPPRTEVRGNNREDGEPVSEPLDASGSADLTLCTTCHRGETLRQLIPGALPGRDHPTRIVNTHAPAAPNEALASR